MCSFYLSPELKDGLGALKARDGMPASEAIRRAIVDFLKQRKIPITSPAKGGKRKPVRS